MIRTSTAFLQILRAVFILLVLLALEIMFYQYSTNSFQQITNKKSSISQTEVKIIRDKSGKLTTPDSYQKLEARNN